MDQGLMGKRALFSIYFRLKSDLDGSGLASLAAICKLEN